MKEYIPKLVELDNELQKAGNNWYNQIKTQNCGNIQCDDILKKIADDFRIGDLKNMNDDLTTGYLKDFNSSLPAIQKLKQTLKTANLQTGGSK